MASAQSAQCVQATRDAGDCPAQLALNLAGTALGGSTTDRTSFCNRCGNQLVRLVQACASGTSVNVTQVQRSEF